MAVNKGEFSIFDDEGKEIECEVLFTFESDETHKNYIVYTDNTLDSDGSTKVYASTYDPKGIDSKLKPIESDKEWKIIETILDELQNTAEEEQDDSKVTNGEESKSEGEVIDEVYFSDDDDASLDEIFEEFSNLEYTEDSMSFNEFIKHICAVKNSNDGKLDEVTLHAILSALEHESEERIIDLLFRVLDDDGFSDVSKYLQLGMTTYSNNQYVVAEEAFKRVVILNPDNFDGRNNLAYMIRRKEIRNSQNISVKEIVELLKPGVTNKDTFSLINMALFWALSVGTEEDWRIADQLVSAVDGAGVHRAYLWWRDIANKGDIEGYVVHLLLMRHGKISNSSLGDIKSLFSKIKAKHTNMPDDFAIIVTPFDNGALV